MKHLEKQLRLAPKADGELQSYFWPLWEMPFSCQLQREPEHLCHIPGTLDQPGTCWWQAGAQPREPCRARTTTKQVVGVKTVWPPPYHTLHLIFYPCLFPVRKLPGTRGGWRQEGLGVEQLYEHGQARQRGCWSERSKVQILAAKSPCSLLLDNEISPG